ncbi:hypothetical protein [Marinibacterium profundimaris]|uniref:Uncharacterized protein n=1 Tax=Marinibacterium profundimaris TaxID=1679460 RepID=A0A225NS06_9RHOB|nr:hypothetical protein [Marinibacterium profundimaris]OWU77632.1 hypothetical protein ATO3_02835 [Marinibacterium profundimaris]
MSDLTRMAQDLEKRIHGASPSGRLELQPELDRVLRLMERDGQRVPARLRNLDEELISEVIEARFDNVPL